MRNMAGVNGKRSKGNTGCDTHKSGTQRLPLRDIERAYCREWLVVGKITFRGVACGLRVSYSLQISRLG
jgi:hypothetical protein